MLLLNFNSILVQKQYKMKTILLFLLVSFSVFSQNTTEKPQTEKPQTEVPQVEKPQTEKPQTEVPRVEKSQTEKPLEDATKTEKIKTDKPLPEKPKFEKLHTEKFKSVKLGETKEIAISLPPSYPKSSSENFPLVIVLDGDYLFDPVNGTLSYGAYWDDLPEMIVVGINQNDTREDDTEATLTDGLPTEKGAKFFEFLGGELLPYLEKKYRITPLKFIIGHDLTAGFQNFYLYKDDPIFNGYISLSPNLPNDAVSRIKNRLSAFKTPFFYYLATADGDTEEAQTAIKELNESIKTINNPSLNYLFDDFKETNHYTLVLKAIPNAFYTFFEQFKPISITEYNNKIEILKEGYVNYLVNKYDNINKKYGIKATIRLNDFKAIEAAILKNKAYYELERLSELAKKNFPKSMLANYELGLMYENKIDYKRAAKAYQDASQLEEIGDLTKDMMTQKTSDMRMLTPKK